MKSTGLTAFFLMAATVVAYTVSAATDVPDEVKTAIASPYFPTVTGGGGY